MDVRKSICGLQALVLTPVRSHLLTCSNAPEKFRLKHRLVFGFTGRRG